MVFRPSLQIPGGALSVNDQLFDALVRHQIGLLRLAGSIRREALLPLDATEEELAARARRALAGLRGLETPADARRLEPLLRALRETRGAGWDGTAAVWAERIREAARAEVAAVDGILRTVSPTVLDTRVPSAETIRRIVETRPFEGRTLAGWGQVARSADQARIAAAVRTGLVQGDGPLLIARRLVGTSTLRGRDGVTQIARRDVDGITRSAVVAVTNQARREYYRENNDVVDEELYVAVLDAATTPICRSLDGELFPVGQGPVPPLHFNALAGGTLIQTEFGPVPIELVPVGARVLTHAGRYRPVTAVMAKSPERREVVELQFDTGRVLRVTDDHPVLAVGRGWIMAGELQVGDQCFEYGQEPPGPELLARVHMEADDHPAPLCESFVPGGVLDQPGAMAASVDFEPDTATGPGEVDQVGPLHMLVDRWVGHILEELQERFLGLGDLLAPAPRECLAHAAPNLGATGWVPEPHAPGGVFRELLRSIGVLHCPVIIPSGPVMVFRGRANAVPSRSDWDLPAFTQMRDLPGWYVEIPGDAAQGSTLAPVVGFDEAPEPCLGDHSRLSSVVSKRTIAYHMPVYNLAVEEDETYTAEGLIVHNCRSLRVAILDGEALARRPAKAATRRGMLREFAEAEGIDPVASRDRLPFGFKGRFDRFERRRVRELTGTVPAKTTYATWLGRQSAAFQDDVLGRSRGRLFRRGGLTLDRFVNRQGDQIPLADLARRDREAFVDAGLDPEDFL